MTGSLLTQSPEFLKYGPLGLAGLMLVLVIVALTLGKLDGRRERLMTKFMYVGAFCFVVASIFAFLPGSSAHWLHFRVEPLSSGEKPKLPLPIFTVNNTRLEKPSYLVSSEATAIIDVTDAVNFVGLYESRDQRQREVLARINAVANQSLPKLEQVRNFAAAEGCPGASHGLAIPGGGAIAGLTGGIIGDLTNAKISIEAITRESPPDPSVIPPRK